MSYIHSRANFNVASLAKKNISYPIISNFELREIPFRDFMVDSISRTRYSRCNGYLDNNDPELCRHLRTCTVRQSSVLTIYHSHYVP